MRTRIRTQWEHGIKHGVHLLSWDGCGGGRVWASM